MAGNTGQPSTAASLQVAVGQHSTPGRKPVNQDFHGLCIPRAPLLDSKGIAIALADGISGSSVSHIASETAVASFLEDYFCTPETWSVRKSAQRVMAAANAWLHAQTRQGRSVRRTDDEDSSDDGRGYITTLSVLVLKSATGHILHVGDSRIYRLRRDTVEVLTEEHRVWVSQGRSQLARALGLAAHVEIDYHTQSLETGDVFILATDGVHEHVDAADIAGAVQAHALDLDQAARVLVERAHANGSGDNLTVQIVRIDALPNPQSHELAHQSTTLPCPPLPQTGTELDGYRILRTLHAGYRSHVYLARDTASSNVVVLKIPSLDQRHDPAYLERLLMEEWIARRIDSRHIAKAAPRTRPRNFLYTASEYVEGSTLTQWMADNPAPGLDAARALVVQLANGLQAIHRLDMLHQDLRPDNILVSDGIVKIVDLGSAHVPGMHEIAGSAGQPPVPGAVQYAAPEYFLGETGTRASDIYSLGAIAYQLLTGRLPYGAEVAKTRTRAAQRKLPYVPIAGDDNDVPAWVDDVLAKAVHPDPGRRYQELSEFVFALEHPESIERRGVRVPLSERDPLVFWKCLCLALAILALILAAYR